LIYKADWLERENFGVKIRFFALEFDRNYLSVPSKWAVSWRRRTLKMPKERRHKIRRRKIKGKLLILFAADKKDHSIKIVKFLSKEAALGN
jgi:hypothetical protein